MKKRKSKQTKGQEGARPFEGLSKVNQNSAGVDIGATEIVARVSDGDEVQLVKAFGNYTVDLQAICAWFRKHGIKTVAMESTGVYWIPLFEELERQGFEGLLINSRSLGENCRAKHGCGSCAVDSDFAQVWTAERIVPTAGRFGGVADIAASPRAVSGTSRATHPAYAEGALADEHPVEPGGDGCDEVDGTKDHPCDRGQYGTTRPHLVRINGVDLSLVDGFGVSLAQTVTMEVGSNVGEKFPTEKIFSSWLGLAPKHDISEGKALNNKTLKTKNRAVQAFRLAAQAVKKADCPFGVLYRRFRSQLGPAQATVATAHATPALHRTQCGASVARVVYKMLKYKVEYDPLSVNECQKQYEEQQVKYMRKRAAKFGYPLVPA